MQGQACEKTAPKSYDIGIWKSGAKVTCRGIWKGGVKKKRQKYVEKLCHILIDVGLVWWKNGHIMVT